MEKKNGPCLFWILFYKNSCDLKCMHRPRRRGSGRSLVISNFLNLLDIKIYQKYASYLPGKLRYPSDSPLSSPTPQPPTPKKFWICEYIVKYVKSTHTFNKQITRLREVSFCLPYPEKNFTNI